MDMILQESETLRLTRALLAQNTVDPPGNEHRAATIISPLLVAEGIEHELIDLSPGRSNLVARIKGNGNRKALAFSAHFDTIGVEAEKWTHGPFAGEVQDGRLYGRGATDMKGAMAAMVLAALQIKRSGKTLEGDLLLAFSASENTGCRGALQLVEHGVFEGVGALLVSEPSSMRLFVSEKGKLTLRVTAVGEYGHNAFSEGRAGDRGNAIVRLARFLDKAHDLQLPASPHRHLKPPTINIGLIHGGHSTVLIPAEAIAEIDVRMVPGLRPETVLEAFRGIAGDHIAIEQVDYLPPVDTADDDPFVLLCIAACSEETGQACVPEGIGYMSDGAVIVPALGIPMVIIGPGEAGMSGAVDEYVELEKLEAATRVFRNIAERYLS